MNLKLFFVILSIVGLSNYGHSVHLKKLKRPTKSEFSADVLNICQKIRAGEDSKIIIPDIRKIFALYEAHKLNFDEFKEAFHKFIQEAAEHGHILYMIGLIDLFEASSEITLSDVKRAWERKVKLRAIYSKEMFSISDLKALLNCAAKSNTEILEKVSEFSQSRGRDYSFSMADLRNAYKIAILSRKPLSFEFFKKNQVHLNLFVSDDDHPNDMASRAIDHILRYPRPDKSLEEIILFCLLINEGFRPDPKLIEKAYDLIDIDMDDIVDLLGGNSSKESRHRLADAITITMNALNEYFGTR